MSKEYLERKELKNQIKHSKSIKKYHSLHRCCKYCKNCYIQTYPVIMGHSFASHECAIKAKSVKESFPRWFCRYFDPTGNNNDLPRKRWYIPPPPRKTES